MGRTKPILFLALFIMLSASTAFFDVWGFYGHRLINRMAVFTVPTPLFAFYKSNLDYVQAHAVDPDKRRYGSPVEAGRHYIDLDMWNDYDPKTLRDPFLDVLLTFAKIERIDKASGENIETYDGLVLPQWYPDYLVDQYQLLRDSTSSHLYDLIGDGSFTFDIDSTVRIVVTDQFALHGYVPYHLLFYQNSLTRAFEQVDVPRILRISAEMGHYIADAHVPLHTTVNYNGQLTGQDGIHAFWETRIPELFAESEYDFFLAKASYIEDKAEYFWNIIQDSHSRVDEVLSIEKELAKEYSVDQQYCYEDRNGRSMRIECQEFARAYQDRMQGMVEERMVQSMQAVGSSWYTAWIDAGKPDLPNMPVLLNSEQINSSRLDSIPENEHILRPIKN